MTRSTTSSGWPCGLGSNINDFKGPLRPGAKLDLDGKPPPETIFAPADDFRSKAGAGAVTGMTLADTHAPRILGPEPYQQRRRRLRELGGPP
jgi:hypothetical protein